MKIASLILILFLSAQACATRIAGLNTDEKGKPVSWILISAEGFTFPEGADLRLSLSEAGFSAYAGCNHGSGKISIYTTEMEFREMIMTEIGCPDRKLMELEDRYFGLFRGRKTFRLDSDSLQLSSGAVILNFRRVRKPVIPLQDTLWQLSALREGEMVTSVVAGGSLRLQLTAGNISVQGTCRTLSAKVKVDKASLHLTDIRETMLPCQNPAVAEQENQVISLLKKNPSYVQDGTSLELNDLLFFHSTP